MSPLSHSVVPSGIELDSGGSINSTCTEHLKFEFEGALAHVQI